MFKCAYLSHGMYVSFDLKGDVLPCCYTSKHDVDRSGAVDILNGPTVSKLRRQALEDQVPDGCSGCIRKEHITGTSPRLHNYVFNDDTVKQTVTEQDIRYLQIRLSNVCNFQCTICNGEDSHLIAKELGYAVPLQSMEDAVYNQLKERLPKMHNLQTVIFAGGEPFYNSKKLVELLDYIPSTAKHIAMHTNGSLYNKPLLDRLYEFEKPRLNFSFDGSGRFFEYQRRNGVWNTAFENLKRIRANYPRLVLQCNNTISNVTFVNLPDFLTEMTPYFNKINIHFIEHPAYYQINTVRNQVLRDVKAKINHDVINKNINHALDNPASHAMITNFWNRVDYLNSKQHNIENFIPEIKDIIKV